MSVVAGCSLFDGVLLAADSRVTYTRQDGSETYVDNGQKLFAVAPGTAIGYVGNVLTASVLLRGLFLQLHQRRCQDPISLGMWMPRLFRAAYARIANQSRPIVFVVASALRDRINFVERAAVVGLVRRIGFSESPIRRNWMPSVSVEILKTDPKYTHVGIPGTSAGLLYVMRAPHFTPEHHKPLQFVAVGSGEGAFHEIAKLYDMIVAGDPGNASVETMWFRTAIEDFIEENAIRSVGGLYPVIKVTGRDDQMIGLSTEIPVGGTRIELAPTGRGH